MDTLADHFADHGVDKVLGIEARGFIIAAPVAYGLGAGFVPVRKAGKLPWQVEKQEYVLEYGTDLLEIHTRCPGPRRPGPDHRRRDGDRRAPPWPPPRWSSGWAPPWSAWGSSWSWPFSGGRGKLDEATTPVSLSQL